MAALSYEKPIEIHSRTMENKDFTIGNTNILPGIVQTVDSQWDCASRKPFNTAIEENFVDDNNNNNNNNNNINGDYDRTMNDSPHPARLVLPAVKTSALASPSAESLTHMLGHVDRNQPTVKSKIEDLRGQMHSAFEELNAITTHDDNLEKQYKETVDENVKLTMSLERARREIRHLKGQLSILQMTKREIREERARREKSYKQQIQYDREIEGSRNEYVVQQPILTAQERSRTVNAQGKYIEHSKRKLEKRHQRNMTYPIVVGGGEKASPQRKAVQETLPPPLSGCNCSMCNAVQSLGAMTFGSNSPMICREHISSSGQQILRGDRVIVKGEKPGTVKYIGRLEGGLSNDVYIGVQLDAPVGFHDGKFKGRQYFQCEPNHGVFVLPSEIICVISRRAQRSQKGGREKLLTSREILNRTYGKLGKVRARVGGNSGRVTITPSGYSIISEKLDEMTMAAHLMEDELRQAKNKTPAFVGSSAEMSKRIQTLEVKNRRKIITPLKTPPPPPPPPPQQQQEEEEEQPSPTEATDNENTDLAPPRPTSPIAKALNESPTGQADKPPASIDAEDKPRSYSPLAMTLLEVLREKDLGTTGFVTFQEFVSCLVSGSIEGLKEITETEAEELLAGLGIQSDSGAGIAYEEIIPYIVDAL